jgi:hypothetical protein
MNYLICDHCQFKNSVNSERIVFCKHCHKKLSNNYLDWKKTKFNSSFETYISETTTENAEPIQILQTELTKKDSIFKRISKTDLSKKSLIFITATVIQFILLFILLNTQNHSVIDADNSTSNYLKDVKWTNYSISQNIDITLPFELIESESVLPCHMHNYLNNEISRKAESSKSFSVTIEELDMNEDYHLGYSPLLSINDAYMQSRDAFIISNEEVDHLKIKDYQAYTQHGSYTLHNKNYLYDNYTLTSGNKAVKIIISYLKDDKLLRKYADIVSQSIFRNKQMI